MPNIVKKIARGFCLLKGGKMDIKAIETIFKGYRFRSRLEARWTIVFDALGIKWEYEMEGFVLSNKEKYLPDFYLPQFDCFAEVKPKVLSEEEFIKCSLLAKPCILLDNSCPLLTRGYFVTGIMPNEGYKNYISNDDYGRVLLDMSAYKKRLWFLWGENISDYSIDITPQIMAQSARFESF
jgi:hypothetical protein